MLNIVLCEDDVKFCSKVQKLLGERAEYDKNIFIFNKYIINFIEKNKRFSDQICF